MRTVYGRITAVILLGVLEIILISFLQKSCSAPVVETIAEPIQEAGKFNMEVIE